MMKTEYWMCALFLVLAGLVASAGKKGVQEDEVEDGVCAERGFAAQPWPRTNVYGFPQLGGDPADVELGNISDGPVFGRLVSQSTGREIRVFIRQNESLRFRTEPGAYRLEWSAGDVWGGFLSGFGKCAQKGTVVVVARAGTVVAPYYGHYDSGRARLAKKNQTVAGETKTVRDGGGQPPRYAVAEQAEKQREPGLNDMQVRVVVPSKQTAQNGQVSGYLCETSERLYAASGGCGPDAKYMSRFYGRTGESLESAAQAAVDRRLAEIGKHREYQSDPGSARHAAGQERYNGSKCSYYAARINQIDKVFHTSPMPSPSDFSLLWNEKYMLLSKIKTECELLGFTWVRDYN